MKSHAFYNPYRWLCFWLASFFTVGNLIAETLTVSNQPLLVGIVSGSVTYTISDGNIVIDSASVTYNNVAEQPRVIVSVAGYPGGVTSNIWDGQTDLVVPYHGVATVAIALVIRYGGDYVVRSWDVSTVPDQPQTVTLSPAGGAGQLAVGQTLNGTASGAQGGNVYNISVISGEGGASINPQTGAFTVTPSGAGLLTYKVWISAGNRFLRSEDKEASIAVTNSEQIRVTVPANASDYPILYSLVQGGQVIGSHTQSPGASAHIITVTVPAGGGGVTLRATTTGAGRSGRSYVDGPEQTITQDLETITPRPAPTPTPQNPNPAPLLPTTAPAPETNQLKKPAAPSPSGPVWSAGNSSSVAAAQTDLLTSQIFREGIDRLAADEQNRLKAQKALTDANPTTQERTMAGAAAAASEAAKVADFDSVPSVQISNSAPIFNITLPAAFGGVQIDLNPFSNERFASICAWHRQACEWLAIVLFGLWCSKEAGQMLRGVNSTNQAKGNAVVGGTGAQATALIAAAAITAVVAVALVAFSSFATTNFGGSTLLSTFDDDPFSGMIGGSVWMLDQLYPLGAIVSFFVGRLVWQAAAQSAYAAAAATIRFIVP